MTAIVLKLFLFAFFVGLTALLAAVEIALTSISPAALKRLAERHPEALPGTKLWEEHPNEVLAAILVSTNLAVIGTSVLAGSIALDVAGLWLAREHVLLVAIPLAAVAVTLVAGEIVPKIYARYHVEPMVRALVPWIARLTVLMRPVNRVLITVTDRILGVLGHKHSRDAGAIKADELSFLLSNEQTAPLPGPTRAMMRRILDFGRMKVRQVMVPRADIYAVDLNQPPQKVIEGIVEQEYSRVPVCRGGIDNIVGVVYSRDVALAWRGGSLFVIDDLIRPVNYVPAGARLDRVLREFKTGHHHLAVVVDEFGATVGLVTIEDLVEEIVGDIWDEYDIQEKTVIALPDGAFLVRARESLAAVAAQTGLVLPGAEFNSVGGWVLDIFSRIPRIGEAAEYGELTVEVVDADRRRVQSVRIRRKLA